MTTNASKQVKIYVGQMLGFSKTYTEHTNKFSCLHHWHWRVEIEIRKTLTHSFTLCIN